MRSLVLTPASTAALALAVSLPGDGSPPGHTHSLAQVGAAPRRNILATEKARYSHAKEELVIRDFFQDRRGGFFLDVGCGHPINDSNTYYLEKHLGWSGIGVDGLPELARRWKRFRPASRFFNFIVTDHADTVETFYRAALSDVSSIEDPGKVPGHTGVSSEKIRVPTTTLTKLLERNNVARIDFLSMDIEGAEPLALAGFDIARFQPQLACVEAKPDNRQKILGYFRDHHYRQMDRYLEHDVMNYYFTPVAGRP